MMSELLTIDNKEEAPFASLAAWKEIKSSFVRDDVPHCWAVSAPRAWHQEILSAIARMYLCDAGLGNDNCAGCKGWGIDKDGGAVHPDLFVAGEIEKAPNIEACRSLMNELPLKPVAAQRRLGVILAADTLLVNAGNSLLKMAEEPPSHVCLLFMLAGNKFLPTLRSRSRFTTIVAPLLLEGKKFPADDNGWLEWFSALSDDENIADTLSAWVSYAMNNGDLQKAVRLDKLRLLTEQQKLSRAMLCDLLILSLKEGLPFERLFGNIW